MDAATINARIYAGRAKAAQRIGFIFNVFRPLTPSAPLGNQVAAINAAFNSGDIEYRRPNSYGKPAWFGDFDGRLTQSGDYLVQMGGGPTYFIAAMQSLLPILCIDCNVSVTITRRAAVASDAVGVVDCCAVSGADAYALGSSSTAWPASLLIKGRAESPLPLPLAVREAGWQLLLPPSAVGPFGPGDVVHDDLGRRYVTEAAERTDLGWRINVKEAHS